MRDIILFMKFEKIDEQIFIAFTLVASESRYHSEITLSQLASKVGITRQAIHKSHYKNIDEVIRGLHFFIDQKPNSKLKKFVLNCEGRQKTSLVKFFAAEILPDLYDKRQYLKVLYGGVADPSWTVFIVQSYVDILVPYFKNSKDSLDLDATFIAKLVVTQVMAIISNWITQEEPEIPSVFAKKFTFLINYSIGDLIDKSNEYKD